jgi:hypothetical protein
MQLAANLRKCLLGAVAVAHLDGAGVRDLASREGMSDL